MVKYINKGPDRKRAILEANIMTNTQPGESRTNKVIEIETYLDCRYISANRPIWHIFQYRELAVERLALLLPFMNKVTHQS